LRTAFSPVLYLRSVCAAYAYREGGTGRLRAILGDRIPVRKKTGAVSVLLKVDSPGGLGTMNKVGYFARSLLVKYIATSGRGIHGPRETAR